MYALRRVVLLLTLLILVAPASAGAVVRLVPVGTFAAPMYVTAPSGDLQRLFVVERGGTIRVVRDGVTLDAPFTDLGGLPTDGERGLLSMAFPPDYSNSGLFYV